MPVFPEEAKRYAGLSGSRSHQPSVIPLLLAALLSARPAGESAIDSCYLESDNAVDYYHGWGQCIASSWPSTLEHGVLRDDFDAGWRYCGGKPVVAPPKSPREDGRAEGSVGGFSLRESYYLAIFVRGGLIFLEFGSRPLRNAKRFLSCCILCFALYGQFPGGGAGGSANMPTNSPKDLLAHRIASKGAALWAQRARFGFHGVGANSRSNMQAGKGAGGSMWGEREAAGDTREREGVDLAAEVVGSSTWRFATAYLLIKLLIKAISITHLDKRHKKMRVFKLLKLAKLGKMAHKPLSRKSFKMAMRMCSTLKLLKLLKLSKKSKKLLPKEHLKHFKLLKAGKVFKLIRLVGMAYALGP